MIELKNIAFGYHQALVSVEHLTLNRGGVYALLGRNGKGKSTIINTIQGQLAPISGDIILDNKSLKSLNAKQRSHLIAGVASKFDGIEFLSVKDYISLGQTPYLNFLGMIGVEQQQLIDEIINSLGIHHLLPYPTKRISDGERQLAAIARALVQNTPIITLDEPTAFLDYINKKQLIESLHSIADKMNKCILFSTHDIELCLENKISIIYISNDGLLKSFESNSKAELLELAF